MIGSLIEEQFKGNAGNWPFGAAASMILLTMVLIILLIFARQQARAEKGAVKLMARNTTTSSTFPGFLPMTILCLVILYAPLVVVTIYSLQ